MFADLYLLRGAGKPCERTGNVRTVLSLDAQGGEVKLIRDDQDEKRTLGVLYAAEGTEICQTLEEPWRDNERRISCIPAGVYTCHRVDSPRFGDSFQVMHVPDRDKILIHAGNTTGDTEGCILLGLSRDGDAVYSSRKALAKFMKLLDGKDSFNLEITDP